MTCRCDDPGPCRCPCHRPEAPINPLSALLGGWTVSHEEWARYGWLRDALIRSIPLERVTPKTAPTDDRLGTECRETCCYPSFVKRGEDGKPQKWTITMDEYQRSNLLWLLCDVAGYDRKEALVPGLQTGDWTGEIANALRVNERGEYEESSHRPNLTAEDWNRMFRGERSLPEASGHEQSEPSEKDSDAGARVANAAPYEAAEDQKATGDLQEHGGAVRLHPREGTGT